MKRITNQEITSTIEEFVNSIYDNDFHGYESGWATATVEEWANAVYTELVNNKDNDGVCYRSNENRFDGKENIYKRIVPMIKQRLQELKEEVIQRGLKLTIVGAE